MSKSIPKDFKRLNSLTGADFHEPNQLFVYAIRCYDEQQHNMLSKIFLKSLKDESEIRITAGGTIEDSPRFSPDGSKLLFLSNAENKGRQIWIVELNTMAYSCQTTMRFGAMEPIWSPQGDKIAFLSMCPDGMAATDLCTLSSPDERSADAIARRKQPIIIEDFGYKFEGMGYAGAMYMQLWVVELSSSAFTIITDGPWNHMQHNWSPCGKNLVFVSGRARPKKETLGMDLFCASATGGEVLQLTQGQWIVSYPTPIRPIYTPDGAYIIVAIFNEPVHGTSGAPHTRLLRIRADGSEHVNIFPENLICHECTAFPYNAGGARLYDRAQLSSDGQWVYFASGWNGQCNLYRASIYGKSSIRPLATGPQAYTGLGIAQNNVMLVSMVSPEHTGDYYLMRESDGKIIKRLTYSNPWISEISISLPEEIWADTSNDSTKIHGWVLPPQELDVSEKYPAVLYIHGGPSPFYTYALDYEMQCFAGSNIAVIYCNPRGSSSYGKEYQDMTHAFNGDAYNDCLKIVNEACSRFPWIDSKRIGVTGGSYGGYMTNYIATHCDEFKAYISQRSVVNDLISYASSDMHHSSRDYDDFGEFMEEKILSSTVSLVEEVNAPFLIQFGMNDLRTPIEGAHQLFTALKETHPDLPVQMILYPNVGHSQPFNMETRIEYYHHMLDWFLRYL